ncbi:MAG: (2Fe-2S)-binding protein [Deltaproteobacteria bacterium]|nr:(2Fe-2S)-binding protein [Deltaproteobacteria bacterium]
MQLEFLLNGKQVALEGVPAHESLLNLLREHLGVFSVKEGCGVGECGACSVLLNGRVVNSCLTPAWRAAGGEVTTVEGLAPQGRPHPIQEAFLEAGAVQCGFCTPGMVLATQSLLAETPRPTDGQIKTGLAGNLCRCTGYHDVVRAVRKAGRKLRGERTK